MWSGVLLIMISAAARELPDSLDKCYTRYPDRSVVGGAAMRVGVVEVQGVPGEGQRGGLVAHEPGHVG